MTTLSKNGCLGSAGTGKLDFCEHCMVGKQKRVSFSIAKHRTQGISDYIHSNFWVLRGFLHLEVSATC